ncbi:acylphosphatase [Motiliproteus sp.]|uniref:acylphosphatase n=1 Tax=Motiliproteus sp. TaxID=1898955 RepID=UPI003BAA7DC3
MERLGLHCWITGRVQGVWFRQATREQAEYHNVSGWVCNLPDGRVEAMLVGEPNAVRQLEAWLSVGPELARVADVEVTLIDEPESFDGFEVR